MTYFWCFSGFLQSYLFSAKDANTRKICIKKVYDKNIGIENVSTYAGNACIRNIYDKYICIKDAYFKNFYINNTYISSFGIIKYLQIYLQSSQISKIRLFSIILKMKLGAN